MINGDPHEFIDYLYTGQDTEFVYKGIKYWFQGYTPTEGTVHMEVWQDEPPADGYLWQYDGTSFTEGQESFQKAPIFDGKTFWEVEQEIEWVG